MEMSSFFFWSEIGGYSIYCKLNWGNRGGNLFLRKRIVRNVSSKFHGEWIYVELFKDLCWNLLDLIARNLGLSKGIDSQNTQSTSGYQK